LLIQTILFLTLLFKPYSEQLPNSFRLHVLPTRSQSNPFNSHFSSLIIRIKQITFILHQSNYSIKFLWIPIGIYGNKVADSLAKSTSTLICPTLIQLTHTDFTPFIRHQIKHLWSSQQYLLPDINKLFLLFFIEHGSTASTKSPI